MRVWPQQLITATRLRSTVLALMLAAVLQGASEAAAAASGASRPVPVPALPAGWSLATLPGADPGVALAALRRATLVPPARYRVVVLPGSGCTGWLPVAPRYFAGLLHAELLVLHKPGVNVSAGLAPECTPDFVENDKLSSWRNHARAALQAHPTPFPPPFPPDPVLPVLLVGISEGAELLPELASQVPALAGVVMISAPGLDPRDAGELQARRLGHEPAWQALARAQASNASDDTVIEGRTLAYWRDFWHWRLAQPLLDAPWPLLRVWGDADGLVPVTAYQQFAQLAHHRAAPFCDLRLPAADHGLQGEPPGQRDGLQWLWARLEAWARQPAAGFCAQVLP
ncbi:alpha/beta hydrolase [Rhodoferax ferrireducens]|uniref:alpha/beta hydrolase n=1 Tax=Rhodoferax ferrireducens TaxID=192843 RepID=UPI00130032B5|nr:alpha/beta hydrolase [Rhodoferax ferrireducens]